jgi:hypothetical protein
LPGLPGRRAWSDVVEEDEAFGRRSDAYLDRLPAQTAGTWEAAPNSRRALAKSLFESVDVLGLDTMHVEPTPAAGRRGLEDFVLMSLLWSGREDLNRP